MLSPSYPPGEHPEAKTCFACLSEIPVEAEVCRACGTRVEGILCPECCSLCPEQARKFRCCGSSLIRPHQVLAHQQTLVIQADPLDTLMLELSLNPQPVVLEADKLSITSFALFGLTSHSEELALGEGGRLLAPLRCVLGRYRDRNQGTDGRNDHLFEQA